MGFVHTGININAGFPAEGVIIQAVYNLPNIGVIIKLSLICRADHIVMQLVYNPQKEKVLKEWN